MVFFTGVYVFYECLSLITSDSQTFEFFLGIIHLLN